MDKDKIKGALYCHLLGDSLGVPHEFRYSNFQYTGKLEYNMILKSRWQPDKKLAIGQYSDDSEMMITLLRSIVKNECYEQKDVLINYMIWANSKTPMMGKNTRSLLNGVKTINGYINRFNNKFNITIDEMYTSCSFK